MNERIRDLADEAAKYSAVMALPTGESGDNLFVNKFAELIVQEHIKILNREWYELNNLPVPENESLRDIGLRVGRKSEIISLIEKIKKHFGLGQ